MVSRCLAMTHEQHLLVKAICVLKTDQPDIISLDFTTSNLMNNHIDAVPIFHAYLHMVPHASQTSTDATLGWHTDN